MLTGHRIEGKAGRDLRNTPRTLGDHHEVNDDQYGEEHQTNRITSPHHEITKCLDDIARSSSARMALKQYDSR